MIKHEKAPFNFLGQDPEPAYAKSKVAILPVPYEATVSYGKGAAKGPKAVIDASRYVEYYDEELGVETCQKVPIHTLKSFKPSAKEKNPKHFIERLEKEADKILSGNKFLVGIGGEHSISSALIKSHLKRHPKMSVLQIDAHADLRDEYGGTPYSHASIAARIADKCPLVQVGIRSTSPEQVKLAKKQNVKILYAHQIKQMTIQDWIREAIDDLTDQVYITIDVDGFDPSIMPSTGTPEPNGLLWHETLQLFKEIARTRKIVGFDVMELAPIPGLRAPDFLVARLIYKLIGLAFTKG